VIKVIGVCGSPRRNSNTELALREALKEIEKEGVEVDIVLLWNKDLKPCNSCNLCKDRDCPIQDDVKVILQKLVEADGIIIASPTYFAQVSAQMKILMDRSVILRRQGMLLKNKVGGAIAVGATRNGGQEFVCDAIHRWMLLHEMIVISDSASAHFGGIGIGSSSEFNAIMKDEEGLRTIRNLGKKVVEVIKLLNK